MIGRLVNVQRAPEGLRNAGYSEDAIFEITLSAAVGAGMARLRVEWSP